MTATATVSRPLRKLLAAGPAIFRDGNALIANDAYPAELLPELEALCLPRISEAEGKEVIALLKAHAGRVRYVVEREEAVDVVAELLEAEALAFDVETAPLPHYRSPVRIAFTKSGALRKRQPTTGAAGLALDPYRSRASSSFPYSAGPAQGLSSLTCSASSAGTRSRRCGRSLLLRRQHATFDVRRAPRRSCHTTPVAGSSTSFACAALTHGLVRAGRCRSPASPAICSTSSCRKGWRFRIGEPSPYPAPNSSTPPSTAS